MATSGWAGDFRGSVFVSGGLFKGGGGFLIDHPLDPANKYLHHSFVESPDRKNVYDGIAVLDGQGEAVVELPAWFSVLNRDFRYQLTCLGGYAPVFVAEEIEGNRFCIGGGSPGLKVSWLVTSIFDAEHPEFSAPVAGEAVIRQIVETLVAHPKVWRKTALFVTYDENGGFFDHVPPPAAPPAATSAKGGPPVLLSGLTFRLILESRCAASDAEVLLEAALPCPDR